MLGKKKPLTHGWIVMPSKTHPDRVYFFNTITGCSTWDNPCQGNDNNFSKSPLPPPTTLSKTPSNTECSSVVKRESITDENPKFPVQTSEKGKRNTDILTIDSTCEIEDYDENDLFFENKKTCPLVITNSPLENNVGFGGLNSKLKKENSKELWWHFSCSKRDIACKSLALSDIQDSLLPSNGVKMSRSSQKSERNWYDRVGTSADERVQKNGFMSPERSRDSSRKGGKRKSKKSPSTSETREPKSDLPKLAKNTAFKRRDRTPAQTRLLKLREKNAELLKEHLSKFSEHQMSKNRERESSAFGYDSGIQDSGSRRLQGDKSCEDLGANTNNACDVTVDDYIEEMDWEPTPEELDAQSINALRQQLDTTRDSCSDIFPSMSPSVTEVSNMSNCWILVLDTNVLVSCLSFIKELRDMSFPELGYPVIYIPWRVLQELDHLKDSRFEKVNSHLSVNVRKAISYLNESFKSQHPRCLGQSFEDFNRMVDADKFAPDDEILQTCIRLQKMQPKKKLTLLTNDKNLESKAIVSHIETYSKEEFQKRYFSSGTNSRMRGHRSRSPSFGVNIDNFFCELKNILRDSIPLVVETEMKLAFDKDWKKLAYKKPPWTLQDSFDCFIRHWRSVFFAIFSKDVLTQMEYLYEKLFSKEPDTVEEINDLAHVILKLLSHIKSSLVSSRSYTDTLESTKSRVFKLLKEISSKKRGADSETVDFSPNQMTNGISFGESSRSEAFTKWEVCQINNLFKDIWSSLNNFCFTLSNLTTTATNNNTQVLLETRMKLTQTLNGLHELIFSIEKILEIRFEDINESHPVIIHLSNFLVKLLPSMESQVQRDLPKFLVLFCLDSEGRSSLSGSLKHFREFAENLTKANAFFEGEHRPF